MTQTIQNRTLRSCSCWHLTPAPGSVFTQREIRWDTTFRVKFPSENSDPSHPATSHSSFLFIRGTAIVHKIPLQLNEPAEWDAPFSLQLSRVMIKLSVGSNVSSFYSGANQYVWKMLQCIRQQLEAKQINSPLAGNAINSSSSVVSYNQLAYSQQKFVPVCPKTYVSTLITVLAELAQPSAG